MPTPVLEGNNNADSNIIRNRSNNQNGQGHGTGRGGVSCVEALGAPMEVRFLRGSNGSFFSNAMCRLCNINGQHLSVQFPRSYGFTWR